MLSSGPWGQLIGLIFWLSPCYTIIMFDCHGFVSQSNVDKGERPLLIAAFLSDSDSLVVDQCSHNVPGKSSSAAAAHLSLFANACRHASPASQKENTYTHTHTHIQTSVPTRAQANTREDNSGTQSLLFTLAPRLCFFFPTIHRCCKEPCFLFLVSPNKVRFSTFSFKCVFGLTFHDKKERKKGNSVFQDRLRTGSVGVTAGTRTHSSVKTSVMFLNLLHEHRDGTEKFLLTFSGHKKQQFSKNSSLHI